MLSIGSVYASMPGAPLYPDRGFLQVLTGQTQHTAIIERALFWDSPDLCLLTLLLVAERPWASLPLIFSVGVVGSDRSLVPP